MALFIEKSSLSVPLYAISIDSHHVLTFCFQQQLRIVTDSIKIADSKIFDLISISQAMASMVKTIHQQVFLAVLAAFFSHDADRLIYFL
jgi:uncharacterized Rmd1/YagE family protein